MVSDFESYCRLHTASLEVGSVCLLCGSTMRHPGSIRRHFEDRHSAERFTCPVVPACGKVCKNRRALKWHIEQHHPQLKGIDPAVCQRR